MIICSRQEANKLINTDVNIFKNDERNKDVIDYQVIPIKHGRGAGVENLTPGMRELIATEALVSGKTIDQIAEEFGVSRDAVNAYKHGATSEATYNQPNHELATVVDNVKSEIKKEAQNKLLTAIQSLTDSKISQAKAKDIAGIAKDMSSVMRNIDGPDGNIINNNRVLIYSPRLKEEDDYKVIEARE